MGAVEGGVSVVITAFRRERLLVECIRSVLESRYRPIEIIVTDDDFSPASRAAVASIDLPPGVMLRHVRGPQSLSYSRNVHSGIKACSYELLVLLHDDNRFAGGGLDALLSGWGAYDGNVDAVFGQQYILTDAGQLDQRATDWSNRYYQKSAPPGPQPSAMWSALTGQLPYDGMMIRRSIALTAGYPLATDVGTKPVDFHFGVRYADISTRPFVLLPDYVSCCRRSTESLSTRTRVYDGHLGFEAIKNVQPRTPLEVEAKRAALDRFAAAAVMGYLSSGRHREAALTLKAHLTRLDKPWAIRLALVGLVAAARLRTGRLPAP